MGIETGFTQHMEDRKYTQFQIWTIQGRERERENRSGLSCKVWKWCMLGKLQLTAGMTGFEEQIFCSGPSPLCFLAPFPVLWKLQYRQKEQDSVFSHNSVLTSNPPPWRREKVLLWATMLPFPTRHHCMYTVVALLRCIVIQKSIRWQMFL